MREAAGELDAEIGEMIRAARQHVAQVVNAGLTLLHWQIGNRIRREVLREERAEYGGLIIDEVSRKLRAEFGRGFGRRNLFHMVRFAEVFPDPGIVQSLITQLGWTHFLHIIAIDDPLKRDFYAEMCRVERWSTRTLAHKIQSMLYERTALSRKPEQLIREELSQLRGGGPISPDLIFQDPYILSFLGLADTYSERDLEAALLREIERFLLELGTGFAFVERQKRITVDGDDYYMDLLFFHRRMRRLVVIELKLGAFKPADKGQVELYLRWLDRHERQQGEEAPVAIILCADRKSETVEYLDLGSSGIHVAQYLTDLPSREVLRKRFHQAISNARARLVAQEEHEAASRDPA
ncbi:MAG TPA: PDDEXK nuclease domain-containing protein [Longimicrobium sp.]|nr:PDDEXK nuclease domain-containing protein [Longimicrobium sp.]